MTLKDLKGYVPGVYKIYFSFYSGGEIHGVRIDTRITIKEKEDDEDEEIKENIDKINEFRETFTLSEDAYSNEKILETLKENDSNFEKTFSALMSD